MKNHFFLFVILGGLLFSFSGCMTAIYQTGRLIEDSGAKNETEGFADVSFDRAWRAARKVFSREGQITAEDQDDGKIDAEISGAEVKLRMDSIAPDCVRIRIRAESSKEAETEELVDRLYSKVLSEIK
ncbi:MAG TPA: hypothetical protein PKL97_08920 [Candidatus Omnitrophota bacterium]|nr:hypothetical protein [Candidatus Omnitrophota bacterium]